MVTIKLVRILVQDTVTNRRHLTRMNSKAIMQMYCTLSSTLSCKKITRHKGDFIY